MLLSQFCAEREHYFRNASWASLSEDLANMLKSVLNQKVRQRITVFKVEFKKAAFKQMGTARMIHLQRGLRLKSPSKLSESRDNTLQTDSRGSTAEIRLKTGLGSQQPALLL